MKSPPEAKCSNILAEDNVLDNVKGCWFRPSRPGGAIFLESSKHMTKNCKTPTFGLQNLQKLVKIRQKVVTLEL